MNRFLVTVIGALALSVTVPAFAGPDFELIQQANKAQLTALAQRNNAQGVPSSRCQQSRSYCRWTTVRAR